DIRDGSSATAPTLISLGLDPFTNGNKLDYSTLHFTNNVTANLGKHTLVFGANFERFVSNNSFFPGSNGVYVFNSIADFKAAATQSAANGNQPSTLLPNRFQYRYSALPGGAEPLQVLKYNKYDAYVQDEIKPYENLRLTFGVRATAVSFSNTALENPLVNTLTFANGEKFNTGEMPKTQILIEPRFGFNLDLNNDATTQVRGGTGIFTGRPPAVFLSNAIGNNGVLTGFIDASGPALTAGKYGFTPTPQQYFTPAVAALPSTIELALTQRNFKFPQTWKSNIAVDQKLPFGFIGTVEGIFSKNINAVNYYNANLDKPTGTFAGPDKRPRYANTDAGVRINDNVSSAVVLENTDEGYFYSTTFKLEYPYQNGLWGSIAYTHSGAYDLMSAGSIAAGSWTGARSVNGNNDLALSAANTNTPNRIVGILGYKITYGDKFGGATSVNLGYIGEQAGTFTYSYGGDMNGDRVNFNDLMFVPLKGSDIRFDPIRVDPRVPTSAIVFTEAQQQAAFEQYIQQDEYLRSRRGMYTERNASVLPMLHRLDLSVTQDFFVKIGGKNNNFQFRADILNFTNLLNKDWGVSKRVTNPNIINASSTVSGVPFFQMATQTDTAGVRTLVKDTFQKNASVFDVWQAQFTLRYIFGK
ncbi:MAG: TonB-dependent receptor, partial [Flavobacterium sp.]